MSGMAVAYMNGMEGYKNSLPKHHRGHLFKYPNQRYLLMWRRKGKELIWNCQKICELFSRKVQERRVHCLYLHMFIQKDYQLRNHSKFLIKYHVIFVCKYRSQVFSQPEDRREHQADYVQYCQRERLRHRGDGDRQRPYTLDDTLHPQTVTTKDST